VRLVYEEIGRLALSNGARLFVVILGPEPSTIRRSLLNGVPGAVVVDAAAALCAQLPGGCTKPMPLDDGAYVKAYAHWAGSPPSLIDLHPNAKAHQIIARGIVHAVAPQALDVHREVCHAH